VLQATEEGEVGQGSDLVVGQVEGIELVLCDTEVLDGGYLVTPQVELTVV
jgi:hypothetical protein